MGPQMYNRGEIWRVDLEPVSFRFVPIEGSETGKVRPALVIGDQQIGRLPVRIIVPITGWNENYRRQPWMTELMPGDGGLTKNSAADALQIRTVSLQRFGDYLGTLPAALVDEIANSVALCIKVPKQ